MYFSSHSAPNKKSKKLNHLRVIEYWHRPGGVLQEVINTMIERGSQSPTELGNEYMEIYIAALFGAGLEKSEEKKVWLSKPETDPPDMVFAVMTNQEGRVFLNSREIEITRHIGETKKIRETILNKTKHKAYPEEYLIICYVEAMGFINLDKLTQDIKDNLEQGKKFHIFLVGHETDPENKEQSYTVMQQLTPVRDRVKVLIKLVIEKYRQDPEKILYVKDGVVYYGLRDEHDVIPNIV